MSSPMGEDEASVAQTCALRLDLCEPSFFTFAMITIPPDVSLGRSIGNVAVPSLIAGKPR